jgi:hypothetical protein
VRKLAHIRTLGMGDPGWGQSQRWIIPGVSPSYSQYDADTEDRPSNLSNRVRGGTHTVHEQVPAQEWTTTRESRIAAQFESLPAARVFQGYFSPSFSWIGARPQIAPRPLHQDFNLGQQGTKELHPATVYNPFPPGGDLFPKVV